MFKKISIVLFAIILGLIITGVPMLANDSVTGNENITVSGEVYGNNQTPPAKTVILVIGDKNATVNGVVYTMDQAAYVKNGRTLVPFRFLAEALGATVGWDANTSTASLNLQGSEVKVTIGSKNASINNTAATLDVPAEVTGGRTFIPLRFVSEALGAKVDYNSETKAVSVVL